MKNTIVKFFGTIKTNKAYDWYLAIFITIRRPVSGELITSSVNDDKKRLKIFLRYRLTLYSWHYKIHASKLESNA